MTTTKRKYRTTSPALIGPFDFKAMHHIFCYKFESESTETGWLGVNLKLRDAFKPSDNHCLVIWTCAQTLLKIDKYHRIEKFSI